MPDAISPHGLPAQAANDERMDDRRQRGAPEAPEPGEAPAPPPEPKPKAPPAEDERGPKAPVELPGRSGPPERVT